MKKVKRLIMKVTGSQQGRKNFRQWIIALLVLCGSYLPLSSFCQDNAGTGIKAGVSGKLSCINTEVTLICDGGAKSAVYRWVGPQGFVSTSQKPLTALPGKYEVTVSDPSIGIVTKSDVEVILDTIHPKGVHVKKSGMLTCVNTVVTIEGNSITPGVRYEWQGPGNFTFLGKKTEISDPGDYQLTVINPDNGCSAKSKLKIVQNIKPPDDVNAVASGMLTCNDKVVKLTASSSTDGVQYLWTGPDFSGNSKVQEVSIPGEYSLKVSDPANGCISKADITVLQDIETPEALKAGVTDTLTCKVSSVLLSVSSSTIGTVYEWFGPEDFISYEKAFMTNIPGKYKLKATNPVNGCSAKKEVTVTKDITTPEDVNVIATGMITCKSNTVVLACVSPTKNVLYEWKGPDGFTSKSLSSKVYQKGTYHVEVTKMSNGCSVKKSVSVIEDKSYPKDVVAISSGDISCGNSNVKLIGKSSTERVKYIWSGPNGFWSDLKEPEINLPGKYILTVVDTVNGCKENADVMVPGEICLIE